MSAETEAVSPHERMSHFRMMGHNFFPYISPYVYQLTLVERPGIGTMAVDTTGRCYYDPEFVEKLTLEQGSYVVLHEAWHLILRHCHRMKDIAGPSPSPHERYIYNCAIDLVVWETMEAIAQHAPSPGEGMEPITWHNMSKEYPALRRNMSAAEIYAVMMDQEERKRQRKEGRGDGGGEPGDDSGDQGGAGQEGNQPGDTRAAGDPSGKGKWQQIGGGSAADGERRDYEEDPNPNWEAFIEDQLLQQVEDKIESHESSGRGNVPGELKRTIKDKLHPAPNPWDCLRASVAKALANHRGSPDYTYQRPNRRQYALPGAPPLKGVKKYQPNACVIVDTSGSMTSACLAKALVVIRQGLQALGKVPVITCDARVTKDVVLSVFQEDFELIGGGGTDMRVPIAHAEKEHKPDCIVLVTDTDTPWPDSPTKAQLIVAATRDGEVPKWATKVRIPDSPNKTRLD